MATPAGHDGVVSRAARRRARGRRTRYVLAVAVIVALAAVAVLVGADATAVLRSRSTPAVRAQPVGPVAGTPPALRLFSAGDSVGLTLTEGLSRVGGPLGDTVVSGAFLGCGLEPAGQVFFRPERLDVAPDGCPGWQDRWPAVVAADRANVAVYLGGSWDMFDRYVDGRWVAFGTPDSDRALSADLDTMIDGLARGGAGVAILTLPYEAPVETTVTVPVYRSGFDPPRVDHFNVLLRAAVARHRRVARLIDLNRFASPTGYTDTLDGIAPFRGDGVHFTDAGADLIATWLRPQLLAVARLAAPRDG